MDTFKQSIAMKNVLKNMKVTNSGLAYNEQEIILSNPAMVHVKTVLSRVLPIKATKQEMFICSDTGKVYVGTGTGISEIQGSETTSDSGGENMAKRITQFTDNISGSTSTPALISCPFDTKSFTEIPSVKVLQYVAGVTGKTLATDKTDSNSDNHNYDSFLVTNINGFKYFSNNSITTLQPENDMVVTTIDTSLYKSMNRIEIF